MSYALSRGGLTHAPTEFWGYVKLSLSYFSMPPSVTPVFLLEKLGNKFLRKFADLPSFCAVHQIGIRSTSGPNFNKCFFQQSEKEANRISS